MGVASTRQCSFNPTVCDKKTRMLIITATSAANRTMRTVRKVWFPWYNAITRCPRWIQWQVKHRQRSVSLRGLGIPGVKTFDSPRTMSMISTPETMSCRPTSCPMNQPTHCLGVQVKPTKISLAENIVTLSHNYRSRHP